MQRIRGYKMKTKLTAANYAETTEKKIHEIARQTLTKPAWVGGVELIGLMEGFDSSELAPEFLSREIKGLESWRELDSHNWGAFEKRAVEDQTQFAKLLLARKASN